MAITEFCIDGRSVEEISRTRGAKQGQGLCGGECEGSHWGGDGGIVWEVS